MTINVIPPYGYGKLARECCGPLLPIQVLRSAAGYYIGTSEDGLPYSRESQEYWQIKEDAEKALQQGNWTQRQHP